MGRQTETGFAGLFLPHCTRNRALHIAAVGLSFLVNIAWPNFASAQQIQVNKSFTPSSVALGANSTVTVTLQNISTTTAANITAFKDDISTMTGHAQLLASPAPTTTCGGTPSIAGQVLSMNNGVIPQAPNPSTPGQCTITFTVVGAAIGNGFNTIATADVVTSAGSPTNDVTQTLVVQSANITATATNPGTVQTGSTSTVTYKITNPAGVPLTNVAFPLAANAASPFSLSNATTTCGGSATLPGTGTSGTANFSGLTIPANSTCTVTVDVTTAAAQTVNFTLAAGTIANDQGATNATGVSAQAKFVDGKPNITKSFNPTAVKQGGTSTLTINVQNVLTDKPLTSAAFTDVLPTSLTLASVTSIGANCGAAGVTGIGTGTISFAGGTIATNSTCTIVVVVNIPVAQPLGRLTNTIPTNSFTSNEVNGSAAAANATLTVVGPGGGVSTAKTASPTSAGVNTPVKITLSFGSLVSGAFNSGTFSDILPQTPVAMVAVTDVAHAPTFTNCGGSPSVSFASGTGGPNTVVNGSNLAIAAGATCVVSFYVQFPNPTSVSRTDTNALLASNVSFTGTSGPVSPAGDVSATITEQPTLSVTNYVASKSGLKNQALTVTATINDPSGTPDTNVSAVFNLTAGKVKLATNPNFTFSGCPAGASASNITIDPSGEKFTVAFASINATCTIGYDVIDEGGVLGTFTPGNSTYAGALTGNAPISYTGQNNVTFATTTLNISKAFTPNQIQAGGTSNTSVVLSVPQAGVLPVTQANGVSFSDALPANVAFAPAPNVSFDAGCQQPGQPAPAFAIAGTTITFTNISLITNGATQTPCTIGFDVTSSVVGAPLNQIPKNTATSTSGITNPQDAKASLTVAAGLGLQKTFVNPTLPLGGTDYVRFLITNSASTATLTGGSLADDMSGLGLALASTTLGPAQAGDPTLCGGAIGTGAVGGTSFVLSGLTVPASTGPTTPGQCVVYVLVTTLANATPGAVTNTVAAGGLSVTPYTNSQPASGSVTIVAGADMQSTTTITSGGSTPTEGSTSVVTSVCKNNGPSPAVNPTCQVSGAPAGASTICGAPSANPFVTGSTITCTTTFTVPNSTAPITISTVAGSDTTDPIPANNPSSVTLNPVTPAAVTVAKTQTSPAAGASVQPGDTIVYTLTATNTGGTAATAYAFYEELPANTSFDTVTAGTATPTVTGCAQNDVGAKLCVVTLDTVPAQSGPTPGTATVTFSVKVAATLPAATTSVANLITDNTTTPPAACTAGVGGACSNPPSTCTANDPHCVATPVAQADMQASAPATVPATIGTPVTVQTVCTNNGPDAALNPTCAVTGVPPSATNVSIVCGAPSATPFVTGSTINCTTTFTPTVAGQITLTTTAGSNTPDPVPANNTAPTVLNPGQITPMPDNATTPFNTPVTIPVTTNDVATGSTINPASVVPTQPAHGSVSCDTAGNCTYTPTTGYTGVDTFNYTVCDNEAPPRCGSTTVTVVVGPKANDDTLTTSQDSPKSDNVSTNDVYPPGSTFAKLTDPSHGSVTFNADGSYTYTPASGYSGTDSFTYQVCEPAPNQALCSTATVHITITPPTLVDPPFITKSVNATDTQTLLWTIVIDNNQNAGVQNVQVRDPLPGGTTYVSGSVTCQLFGGSTVSSCFYDAVNNRIVADAALASDLGSTNPATAPNRVVIVFSAKFTTTPVTNVAQACWDAQNNAGNIAACAQSSSGTASYTPSTPPTPTVPAPIDSRWMLALMVLLAISAAVATRNKTSHK